MSAPTITFYTDGSSTGRSDSIGGWAYVALLPDGRTFTEGAHVPAPTTNQRMEMRAVIEALGMARPHEHVIIYSDSAYVVNCFNEDWFSKWRKRGWRNAKGKPVSNRDLWERLVEAVERLPEGVEFRYVKGHAGNRWNNEADRLAVAYRKQEAA